MGTIRHFVRFGVIDDASAIEHERENRPHHLYRVKQADLHSALKRLTVYVSSASYAGEEFTYCSVSFAG